VFITHDLSLLVEIADRIAVMYAGALWKKRRPGAPREALPSLHDRFDELFPPLGGPRQRLQGIPGQPPDLRNLPKGCSFAPRCPQVIAGTCERSIRRPFALTGTAGCSATSSAKGRPTMVSTLGLPAETSESASPELEVRGLTKNYSIGRIGRQKVVRALSEVDLSVEKGR